MHHSRTMMCIVWWWSLDAEVKYDFSKRHWEQISSGRDLFWSSYPHTHQFHIQSSQEVPLPSLCTESRGITAQLRDGRDASHPSYPGRPSRDSSPRLLRQRRGEELPIHLFQVVSPWSPNIINPVKNSIKPAAWLHVNTKVNLSSWEQRCPGVSAHYTHPPTWPTSAFM